MPRQFFICRLVIRKFGLLTSILTVILSLCILLSYTASGGVTPLEAHSIQQADSRYDNLILGVPGKADAIVDRVGFALGYDETTEQARWVTYLLTGKEATTKVAKRTDRFLEDPEIPDGSATDADYRKSGYDRGHLAPAADMAFSLQTMADSFYYSNMSPQKPAFNRGIWGRLEKQVREFAVAEEKIHVVTGPIFTPDDTITIGPNNVGVPSSYYKVIYDLTPPRKMIGFILPNEGSKRPLQDFAVTVNAVEAVTGLDFFSLVPEKEKEALKNTITITDWSWQQTATTGKVK